MKLLILFFIFAGYLWASDDCPEQSTFQNVDLRSQLGPIRDQDSVGWCFAFSTADLVTHWMSLHKEELGMGDIDFTQKDNMVSAAAVALTYNSYSRPGFSRLDLYRDQLRREELNIEIGRNEVELSQRVRQLYSGDERLTRLQGELDQLLEEMARSTEHGRSMRDRRLHLESELNELGGPLLARDSVVQELKATLAGLQEELSKLSAYAEPNGGLLSKALRSVLENGIFFERDIHSDDYEHFSLDGVIEMIYQYPLRELPCEGCNEAEAISQLFALANLEQIDAILQEGFVGVDPVKELLEISSDRFYFSPTVRPRLMREEHRSESRSDGSFAWADQILESGNIVEVSYDASCLKFVPNDRNSSHSSSLVGKRYNCELGEPEYILRNSWGEQACQRDYQYQLGSRLKSMSLEEAIADLPFTCDEGYYIIRKSVLEANLRQFSAIQ